MDAYLHLHINAFLVCEYAFAVIKMADCKKNITILAKLCNRKSNAFIILYADDILLLAPSVCELDNLFKICERELKLLDMTLNCGRLLVYAARSDVV